MDVETQQPFAVDITNCDREPIHVLGTIQPFGFLIAVSSDWLIARVSVNAEQWTGLAADAMLGKPLSSFLLPDDPPFITSETASPC